jgi:hypothetical protein
MNILSIYSQTTPSYVFASLTFSPKETSINQQSNI